MFEYISDSWLMMGLGIVACLIVNVAPVLLYFKRRREKRRFEEKSSSEIDHAALEAAEKAVLSMNLQEELYKNMTPIKKFSSLHGHDDNSMTRIIEMLHKNDITADYYFTQAAPAGVMSYTGPMGTYQLFVGKDQSEQASQLLKRFLES